MRLSFTLLKAAAVVTVMLAPGVAFAHPGVGAATGFDHGFAHPFSGLDHLLAMVTVGVFACRLGGRALWAVPAAFIALMMVGGALGMAGIAVPFVELGIALSLVVLGAVVALNVAPPLALSLGLVGFFALFHGHAHGAEMPVAASGIDYALGFVLATALLHGLGLMLGFGLHRLARRADRLAFGAAGSLVSLAGLGLLLGLV